MVETTQTKPSATTGLVNTVDNKLLGNQPTTTTTTTTGLNNPLQAPPRQEGVIGTGLTGATNATTGVPLTGTTGSTYNTTTGQQQHTGVFQKLKDTLTGHHSTTGQPLQSGTGYSTGAPLTTGSTGYSSGQPLQQPLQSGTGFSTGQPLQQPLQSGTGFSSGVPLQSGTGFTSGSSTFGSSTTTTGSRMSGTTYGAPGPMSSETLLTQKPLVQQQTFVQPVATQVINEKPILERVEKFVHKDVVERPHIIEQHEKELIEVHEQPIEKRILHPSQEFRVQEAELYETTGRDLAESERLRLIEEMRMRDMNRRVDVQEHQDVRITQQAPTVQMQQELRKEIIQKPIVTEIHEQPIVEIHEQNIHKTVYEKPVVNYVREAPIVESVITSNTPLSGLESTITRGMHSMNLGTQPVVQQPIIQQQQVFTQPRVVQQPVISTTVVEKSLTDPIPHVTANTGINPPVTRK